MIYIALVTAIAPVLFVCILSIKSMYDTIIDWIADSKELGIKRYSVLYDELSFDIYPFLFVTLSLVSILYLFSRVM